MLKIENSEVMGWEHAIRGMRNPKNSWERSDTVYIPDTPRLDYHGNVADIVPAHYKDVYKPVEQGDSVFGGKFSCGLNENVPVSIGPNDHQLMASLAKGGPVHAKYRRMITVYLDITAPLYWWKEFDTYKVGTVANSCSTMHKLTAKEFTLEDFSHDHLMHDRNECWEEDVMTGSECIDTPMDILEHIVDALNLYRAKYLEAKTKPMKEEAKRAGLMKKYWWQMIQLLPSSYNQKRTVMLNYEVLHNIYISRRHHKLDEWHVFCDWIESLPYSELITGGAE